MFRLFTLITSVISSDDKLCRRSRENVVHVPKDKRIYQVSHASTILRIVHKSTGFNYRRGGG